VRGRFTTPKSKASRRIVELRPRTLSIIEEQWRHTAYGGTTISSSAIRRRGRRSTRANSPSATSSPRAGIEKPFRPFHDLRYTSLTHAAAAGNPQAYVQAQAGHSQGSITERYMHAAQVLFLGAAERSEVRMFGRTPSRCLFKTRRQHRRAGVVWRWSRTPGSSSRDWTLPIRVRRRRPQHRHRDQLERRTPPGRRHPSDPTDRRIGV